MTLSTKNITKNIITAKLILKLLHSKNMTIKKTWFLFIFYLT